MQFQNLLVETKDGCAQITINRPKVHNALNPELLCELETLVRELDKDAAVRVVIITGSGERAFVSGADIAAMREMSAADAGEFAKCGHSCMRAIGECSKPVIAAVNGFALGGGTELALACDIIIAADCAKFGLPEVKLGLYPGFGGTQRLPRLIGSQRARELIFTGRVIDAKEALSLGLVGRVVPLSDLLFEARKLAALIAANAPVAIGLAKRLINDGASLALNEALNQEREGFSKLFQTEDRVEGISAFLEKRQPVFKGK